MLMALVCYGEKYGVLTDVLRPEGMEIYNGKLYVVEDSTFFVYSLKDLKYITRFCAKGEGPGELSKIVMIPNSIKPLEDKLIAEGVNKIIFFSNDFKVLKEVKKKEMVTKTMPIGDNFVAVRMSVEPGKAIFSLMLFDPGLNALKEFYKQETEHAMDKPDALPDTIHYAIYKDKIYVEESKKGFVIGVFDNKGNPLYEIKKDFKSLVLTDKDRKEILNCLKEDPFFINVAKKMGGWENVEKSGNFVFPETFPAIRDILVVDGKIYTPTYERKDNKEKYVIMDLKGNVKRIVYLPVTIKSPFSARMSGRENRFYGIASDKFYYLVENVDNEEWEIHTTGIK
jgi:hypothetical protein